MEDIVTYFLIGILSGLLSGLFGIGGSVVSTPLLVLFTTLPPIITFATPLVAAVPSAIAGSYHYLRNKIVSFQIAGWTLLTAIPFSLLGTYLTKFIDDDILILLKVIFLFLLGLKFLFYRYLVKESKEFPKSQVLRSIISGIFAGFVAGIIAIGGGVVLVATYTTINKLNMRQAVATSLFCVGIIALINSVMHYMLGNIVLHIALAVSLGAIPAAYFGSRLGMLFKAKYHEQAFGTFASLFALYFILKQLIGF